MSLLIGNWKVCRTIQMKAIEQYSPGVLFITLNNMWFSLLSLWIRYLTVTIQMKATE